MLLHVATSPELPNLSPDCRLLLPALREVGFDPKVVAWSDPDVDWSEADALLIRSVWDYYRQHDDFLGWLDRLEGLEAPVINPIDVVRANLDKRYLGALEAAGAPIVATRYAEGSEALRRAVAQTASAEVVLKPTVNAAGIDTFRVRSDSPDELAAALEGVRGRGEVIVQPFLPEILADGEWSLVWLGGEFSHAVRKRARPGEFRVQDDWGGTVHLEPAPRSAIAAAPAILRAAEEVFGHDDLAYVRIDGVITDRGFLLMELELIEPELFFRAHEPSTTRLAKTLWDRLG